MSREGNEALAKKTIILARKHLSGDSARVALEDANKLYDEGDYKHAYSRALKSLAYSVGVFHKDYQSVS